MTLKRQSNVKDLGFLKMAARNWVFLQMAARKLTGGESPQKEKLALYLLICFIYLPNNSFC